MPLTAPATGMLLAADDPQANETRRVRMLVPTRRKSEMFLDNDDDVLRASDLGITRFTTDEDLANLAGQPELAEFITSAVDLRRLRDALAQPRDITEARAWGYIVPVNEHENSEEELADPLDRLGWWWVYHPDRQETRFQRRARYRADTRLIDVKGMARIFCRAHSTTKDMKIATDRRRKIVDLPDHRRELAERFAANNTAFTVEKAEEFLLTEAEQFLLKGTPRPVARGGKSDLFRVCDAVKCGRNAGKINEWYEFDQKNPPGRPPKAGAGKR